MIEAVIADAHQHHEIERRAVAHDAFRIRRVGLRLRTPELQIVASCGLALLGSGEKNETIARLRSRGCRIVRLVLPHAGKDAQGIRAVAAPNMARRRHK